MQFILLLSLYFVGITIANRWYWEMLLAREFSYARFLRCNLRNRLLVKL